MQRKSRRAHGHPSPYLNILNGADCLNWRYYSIMIVIIKTIIIWKKPEHAKPRQRLLKLLKHVSEPDKSSFVWSVLKRGSLWVGTCGLWNAAWSSTSGVGVAGIFSQRVAAAPLARTWCAALSIVGAGGSTLRVQAGWGSDRGAVFWMWCLSKQTCCMPTGQWSFRTRRWLRDQDPLHLDATYLSGARLIANIRFWSELLRTVITWQKFQSSRLKEAWQEDPPPFPG